MWLYFIIALLISYVIILRMQLQVANSSLAKSSTVDVSSLKSDSGKQSKESSKARKKQKSASLLTSFVDSVLPSSYKLKQVIILRKDLSMKTGKLVAQGAHASLGCISLIEKGKHSEWMQWKSTWEMVGTAKIALKVQSEEALQELRRQALDADLPHYLVRDAGKTQVASGSVTALAIGPAPVEKIDQIAGKLKLL